MTMLTTEGWAWQPDKCPSDKDFVEYIQKEKLYTKVIYQMGPGLHHYVGQTLRSNLTIAITSSSEEVESFIEIVKNDPGISSFYSVMFGDIYCVDIRLLPKFDIVYLPHLGEMQNDYRKQYTNFSDKDVLYYLLKKLKPKGILVGYRGSSAWDRVATVFSEQADNVGMYWKHDFNSLKVWQKK